MEASVKPPHGVALSVFGLAVLGAAWLWYVAAGDGGFPFVDRGAWVLVFVCGGLAWAGLLSGCFTATVPKRFLIPAAIALLAIGLQTVPLPIEVVAVLSPRRAELLKGAGALLGSAPFAALSVAPERTVSHLAGAIAYLLVFILVLQLSTRLRHRPWLAIAPLIAIGAFEALAGIMQGTMAPNAAARGTFINRNHFGALLHMCLPFTVMYATAAFRRRTGPPLAAYVSLGVAGGMAAGIVFSGSRMALFSAVTGLVAATLIGFASGGHRRWSRWTKAAAIFAGGAVLFVFMAPAKLIDRFGELEQDASRPEHWRDALRMIEAYPALGCGYGAYRSAIMPLQTSFPMHLAAYAHNDYLQAMAELGIPAALAVFAGGVLVFRKALQNARNAVWHEERYRALACIGAFVAIALHSLVDFNLYVPANAAALAWISGIAVAEVETA